MKNFKINIRVAASLVEIKAIKYSLAAAGQYGATVIDFIKPTSSANLSTKTEFRIQFNYAAWHAIWFAQLVVNAMLALFAVTELRWNFQTRVLQLLYLRLN